MDRRIGITILFVERCTRPQVIELARQAEALGYDTLWMSEAWGRDAFTILTYIAANTSRIRLAPGIVSVYARSPAITAQSIASLDEIAEGRTALGLGVGSEALTENWHGQSFDNPMQRIREYTEVVRAIATGERVDYQGRFYRVNKFRPLFRPIQEHLPIYLAALGPQMVELAGEVADGWFPNFMSAEALPRFRAHLETGAQRSGREAANVDLYIQRHTCASEDAKLARQLAREALAFIVGGYGPFYRKMAARLGFAEEAAAIERLWNTDRRNIAAGVSDAFLEALTISGTPEQCRNRLLELEEQGLGPISICVPQAAPIEIVRETIDAMGPSRFA